MKVESSKETSSSMPRVENRVVAADEGDDDKVGVTWNDTCKKKGKIFKIKFLSLTHQILPFVLGYEHGKLVWN